MPIDPMFVDQSLGNPLPGSREVRVSGEMRRGFGRFQGPSIPFDYRSYILYADTILPGGTRILTRFEIDTRKPTLLIDDGLWYIDGTWYSPFDPEALKLLGVAPEEARPFSWTPNVPIETIEQPPYREGQILHGRMPPTPAMAPPFSRSNERVGGGSLMSLDLEAGESNQRTWSCEARRIGSVENGKLFLTRRRVLFCPHRSDDSMGVEPFVAGIRELIDVGCKPVADPRSGEDRKMGLRLVLVGGREEIFMVDDILPVIERFSDVIHPVD